MLVKISIKDFGIVEQITFQPDSGLNVLTGETGAGKSLILGAIDVVLGGKCNSGIIRHGSPKAVVEACFNIKGATSIFSWLQKHDILVENNALFLCREIAIRGRPRPLINGKRMHLNLYRELASQLVEFHGQHENQRILDVETHLDYLDQFAGTLNQRKSVAQLHNKYYRIKERLRILNIESEERKRRLDFLHFVLDEIEEFEPAIGEFEDLMQEKLIIDNSGHLFQDLNHCYNSLREKEHSITDKLEQVILKLKNHTSLIPELKEHLKNIQEGFYLLEAATDFIRAKKESLNFSTERLEEIEDRISVYRGMFKKYGGDTEAVICTQNKYLNELAGLEMSAEEMELLLSESHITYAKLLDEAEKLSRNRRSVISELETRLASELSELGMQGAKLKISVQREVVPESKMLHKGETKEFIIHNSGVDKVEFLLAANTGEGTKPLNKIASGGELSRITLALKTIFFEINPVGMVIFDEVDSGVGGEIAHTIASRLNRLARHSQVLVVTHLHQIASTADSHFQIQKIIQNGRTISVVSKLTEELRINEMTRMLGGNLQDNAVIEHARKLLVKNSAA